MAKVFKLGIALCVACVVVCVWCVWFQVGQDAQGVNSPMTTKCAFLNTYYTRRFAWPQTPPVGKQICSTGIYQFEYLEDVHQRPGPKTWKEVAELPCKYINFGADGDRHGNTNYLNYVAVQGSSSTDGWGCALDASSQREEYGEWCVCHDLRTAIPLPNSSVDRIHSKDLFEHIDHWHYPALLKEIHRLLKLGGRARIGTPDYGDPKDEETWKKNHTMAMPEGSHRTLTNYALWKKYVDQSPFKKAEWLLYYDNTVPGAKFSSRHLPDGAFINSHEYPLPLIRKEIDYTLGVVRRTPDVDCRNNILAGRYFVSSVVFDLVKDSEV